jgi:hypothetical protein
VHEATRLRRLVFKFLNQKGEAQKRREQKAATAAAIRRAGSDASGGVVSLVAERHRMPDPIRVVVDSAAVNAAPENEAERFWIQLDAESSSSDPQLVLRARLAASVFAAKGGDAEDVGVTEARLLNAVLMALTADAVDGRVTVDRVVRRFVQQQHYLPQSQAAVHATPTSSSCVPTILRDGPALQALDRLCLRKGYASLYELLIYACGAVPLEAQLGPMSVPVGVDSRDVPCGALLMSRAMLPSKILTRDEALQTLGEN